MIWPIRFGGWCAKVASEAKGSDIWLPRSAWELARDALRRQRMHMRHDLKADAERRELHYHAERGNDQTKRFHPQQRSCGHGGAASRCQPLLDIRSYGVFVCQVLNERQWLHHSHTWKMPSSNPDKKYENTRQNVLKRQPHIEGSPYKLFCIRQGR